MTMIVRAIDVGYGNTKYVTHCEEGAIHCASFPSVAYPSSRDQTKLPGMDKRKTVAVPIGSLYYEVGPEVSLAAEAFQATQLHDGYIETREYAALLRGALNLMKVEVIDLLVVGLPVSLFVQKKNQLEKLVTGTHDVGGGRQVVVRKGLAVAQPQGALAYFAWLNNKLDTIGEEQSLVIDAGARTFDWLATRGVRMVRKRSGSVNRGMWDVLEAIARDIGHDLGGRYQDFETIDRALRDKKSPVIGQKPYDIKRLMPIGKTVAGQAVSAMLRSIDDIYGFQNILLVGGGAFWFRDDVRRAFPKLKVQELKDPLYANVRGFQIAGMNYAKSAMEKATTAPSTDDHRHTEDGGQS